MRRRTGNGIRKVARGQGSNIVGVDEDFGFYSKLDAKILKCFEQLRGMI